MTISFIYFWHLSVILTPIHLPTLAPPSPPSCNHYAWRGTGLFAVFLSGVIFICKFHRLEHTFGGGREWQRETEGQTEEGKEADGEIMALVFSLPYDLETVIALEIKARGEKCETRETR